MNANEAIDRIRVSDEEFAEFFAYNRNAAESTIKRGVEGFAPMLTMLVTGANGKRSVAIVQIATDFNTPEEKRSIMHQAGRLCYDNKAIPVVAALSSEAWFSVQEDANNIIPAGEDPNRKEVIMVQCATLWRAINDLGKHAHWQTTRNDGKLILGAYEEINGGEFNLLYKILEPLRDVYLSNLAERN